MGCLYFVIFTYAENVHIFTADKKELCIKLNHFVMDTLCYLLVLYFRNSDNYNSESSMSYHRYRLVEDEKIPRGKVLAFLFFLFIA